MANELFKTKTAHLSNYDKYNEQNKTSDWFQLNLLLN